MMETFFNRAVHFEKHMADEFLKCVQYNLRNVILIKSVVNSHMWLVTTLLDSAA